MDIEYFRELCKSLGGEFSIEPSTRIHAFVVPMFLSGADVYVCKVGNVRIEFDGRRAELYYSKTYDKVAPDISRVIVRHITNSICEADVRPAGLTDIESGITCRLDTVITGDLYKDNDNLLKKLDEFRDAVAKAKDYMNTYDVVLLKHWNVEV